jgi:hypothetical protein|tara:strand:- start:1932 stop:2183 length:252 start_codon:yes stop_codon:yes gene_type:complete
MKTNVEFRIVNTSELPPIVISQNENDEPKVVLNTYHRIWISLNRKIIAGIIDNLPEKIDMILTGYLQEQRQFEKDDLEMMNDG